LLFLIRVKYLQLAFKLFSFFLLPVITTPIGAEGLFLESSKSIDYNILDKLKDSSFYSEMNVFYNILI